MKKIIQIIAILILAQLASSIAAENSFTETIQLPESNSLWWVKKNIQAKDAKVWDAKLDEQNWGTPSTKQAVSKFWDMSFSKEEWDNAVKINGEGKFEDVKFDLWFPDGVSVAKGIVVMSGHGNGEKLFINPSFRAMAKELNLALLKFTGNPMQRGFWPTSLLDDRLKALAKVSAHPELEYAPLFLYGHSNGTGFSAIYPANNPGRVWGWACMNPGVTFQVYQPGGAQVPGLVIFGENDSFFARPSREENIAVVPELRKKFNALWNFAVIPNGGHGPDGMTWPLLFSFLKNTFAARVPDNADPSKGAVALNALEVERGYLGQNWDLIKVGVQDLDVGPYASFSGDKSTASWLINADYASEWQKFHREVRNATPNPAPNSSNAKMEPASGSAALAPAPTSK